MRIRIWRSFAHLRAQLGLGSDLDALQEVSKGKVTTAPSAHTGQEDYAFSRSRTHVKLFEVGTAFVSRSEAKRLLGGLEKFEEVIVDFGGVDAIGQGFADEVFRVWARSHSKTRLTPVKMNRVVEMMVRRAR